MNLPNLATYANDHLVEATLGTEHRPFFEQLRGDIAEDQEALRQIPTDWGVQESGVHKAAAWLVEKVCWAKLKSIVRTKVGWDACKRWKGCCSALPASSPFGDCSRTLKCRSEELTSRSSSSGRSGN